MVRTVRFCRRQGIFDLLSTMIFSRRTVLHGVNNNQETGPTVIRFSYAKINIVEAVFLVINF
jgi:hypothetical protein